MNIEKLLKQRERDSEDQIITNESIVKTDDFTGLIEESRISNMKTTTLFLIKYEFENMAPIRIIEEVQKHILIGEEYRYQESDPYIMISYGQTRECN